MPSRLHLFMVIFLTLVASSCSVIRYAPDTQNVPLFKEKNEVKVAAGWGLSEHTGQTTFRGAYSFADHWGAMANFTYYEGGSDISIKADGYNAEVGAGYFTTLGRKKLWVFETYTGLGLGKMHYRQQQFEPQTWKFRRWFLQPAIGINSDHIEAAVSCRLSYFQPYYVHSANPAAPIFERHDYMHEAYLFLEPALTLRTGIREAKLQFQLQTSSLLNHQNFLYDPFMASVMLELRVDRIVDYFTGQ